jgi:hypothetical protein
MRGACEIFAYSHNVVGEPIRPRYLGCVWQTRADMLAFYADGPHQSACDAPGFVDYRDFDDWEEAERWLTGAAR